jgi:beta-phosphoglucomutase-like phosphatase (HAD superfamily)
MSASARLRAVLFDMDGTLVQTEEFWGEAMFELAARLGGRMSDEARAQTVGTSMQTSRRILYADLLVPGGGRPPAGRR